MILIPCKFLSSVVLLTKNLEKPAFGWQNFVFGRTLTLEQIGSIMGVSRERVRQIESQALKKAKASVKA